jgi:glyoxylase-like metal-dependent hydrolase (beta-lactamase superfamily II)
VSVPEWLAPGHHVASIALYDRRTGNLLTGDSLYAGRLYVNEADVPAYAAGRAFPGSLERM